MARIRTHPGEVLKEEFMAPLDLSANRLAIELAVPATRIGDIIRSENPRAITADTALRLARYDLEVVQAKVDKAIHREVKAFVIRSLRRSLGHPHVPSVAPLIARGRAFASTRLIGAHHMTRYNDYYHE